MGVAVIHVVDDHAATTNSSSSSKEFRCDAKLLQAHMRLLRPTCAAVAPGQDIEVCLLLACTCTQVPSADVQAHNPHPLHTWPQLQITVKCDISTFAWLMAYVKAADSSDQQQPEPNLGNCVQLLLASHYLQVRAKTASTHAAARIGLSTPVCLPQSSAGTDRILYCCCCCSHPFATDAACAEVMRGFHCHQPVGPSANSSCPALWPGELPAGQSCQGVCVWPALK
jgi:hypothetical protein